MLTPKTIRRLIFTATRSNSNNTCTTHHVAVGRAYTLKTRVRHQDGRFERVIAPLCACEVLVFTAIVA